MKKYAFLTMLSVLLAWVAPAFAQNIETQTLLNRMIVAAESSSATGMPSCMLHSVRQKASNFEAEISSQCKEFVPGQDIHLKVVLRAEGDWHFYYGPNPGEIAQNTVFDWQLPPGFEISKTNWPVPVKYIDKIGTLNYIYDKDLELFHTLKTPENVQLPAQIDLTAKLQLCGTRCVMQDIKLNIQFYPVSKEKPSCANMSASEMPCQSWAEQIHAYPEKIESRVVLKNTSEKDNIVAVRIDDPRIDKNADISFIFDRIENRKIDLLDSFKDENAIYAVANILCDGNCKALSALDFLVVSEKDKKINGFRSENTSLQSCDRTTDRSLCDKIDWKKYEKSADIAAVTTPQAPDNDQNIFWILLMAFLGGLILNVMPCVLPVLSLKAFSLVSESHGNTVKNLSAYTLGVLVSFWVLGAAILALKLTGQSVGWGFQFQEPYYVIGMIVFVFAFGLSLLGVFEIPGISMSGNAPSTGLKAAFVQGVMLTALATPCSAPLLGTALVFVIQRQSWEIFLVLSFVGIGLVLPVALLSLIPSFKKWIPKPGNWMMTFKQIVAFFLIGTVIYLVNILAGQISTDAMNNIYILLLCVAVAAWILGKWAGILASKRSKIIALVLAVAFVAAPIALLDMTERKTAVAQEHTDGVPWQYFSEDLLQQKLNTKTHILLDFTAEWCPTCKVNEKLAINTPAVVDALHQYRVTPVKVDMTLRNDAGQKWIAYFDRAAIPLVVVIPNGNLEQSIVLPEVFNEQTLLDAIAKVKDMP